MVSSPIGIRQVLHKSGNTKDIINAILYADAKDKSDVKKLALSLRGENNLQTCRNIWNYITKNIKYKVDPIGQQFIKSPAKLFYDKTGDCKSFSLFYASILKALKIPYKYRFASYTNSKTEFTHVYVIADNTIICDAVMDQFNKEKNYSHKKDYNMTQISYMAGIKQPRIGIIEDIITVSKTVIDVAETVGGWVGKLFGGGSAASAWSKSSVKEKRALIDPLVYSAIYDKRLQVYGGKNEVFVYIYDTLNNNKLFEGSAESYVSFYQKNNWILGLVMNNYGLTADGMGYYVGKPFYDSVYNYVVNNQGKKPMPREFSDSNGTNLVIMINDQLGGNNQIVYWGDLDNAKGGGGSTKYGGDTTETPNTAQETKSSSTIPLLAAGTILLAKIL